MKGINNLFEKVHSPVTLSEMIPLGDLKDPNKRFRIRHRYPNMNITFKDVEVAASILECSVNDLYFIPDSFYPFAFYRNYLYIDTLSLDPSVLVFSQMRERIKAQMERIEGCLREEDYETLFAVCLDKKIMFSTLNELHNRIPNDQLYSILIDNYSRSDYGFTSIDRKVIQRIVETVPETEKEKIRNSLSKFVKNGKITVYRGETDKSTPYTKAYSWTLDIGVATFFATRFDSNGRLYKGEVSLESVWAFLEDRNESEVLITPESLINVKEIPYKGYAQVMKEMESEGYITQFEIHKQKIKPELFHNPSGIHGVHHVERVLLHVTNLANLLNLSFGDYRILVLAALYHDIGRINDDEDPEHGYLSYEKMIRLGLYKPDNAHEHEIVKAIISLHCLSDGEALHRLGKDYKIEDKARAEYLLKIFKDADGLDRVRLGDLDIEYLRNPVSKMLVGFARDVLKRIN